MNPRIFMLKRQAPNYNTTLFQPEKRNFGEATIELQVLI
jgi:hypothetical protein